MAGQVTAQNSCGTLPSFLGGWVELGGAVHGRANQAELSRLSYPDNQRERIFRRGAACDP